MVINHSNFREIREELRFLSQIKDIKRLDHILGRQKTHSYLARKYARDGNLFLFRKYVIMHNSTAKIIKKLIGEDILEFPMDNIMKEKCRG